MIWRTPFESNDPQPAFLRAGGPSRVTRPRSSLEHVWLGGRGRPRGRLHQPQQRGLKLAYRKDARVDAYLGALPTWQGEILQEVRDLVHSADPEVEETIKRSVQPYFVLDGNICAFLAARDHVNVFLYDGGIVPDPAGIITAGHDNHTARTVGFRAGDTVNRPALLAMFKQIIANNRSGGWRKLKVGK